MSDEEVVMSRGFFRERGTLRLVVTVALVALVWFAYSTIHVSLMQKVKWPPLQPDLAGLTVIGLKDKEHGSYQPDYKAIEVGHAWQIRRTDTGEASHSDNDPDADSEELKDRAQAMPAGAGRVSRGAVVPLKELLEKLPTVLTGKQFVSASVQGRTDPFFDRKYNLVHLALSDEGRSRLWQYSRAHEGERLAFILKGQVLFCPRISNMDVSSVTIDPVWDKSDADTMADFVNRTGK